MAIVNTIKLEEKERTYYFAGGDKVELKDVVELGFGSSGTHRVKTSDGKLHIISQGWLHVEITANDWTI